VFQKGLQKTSIIGISDVVLKSDLGLGRA